MSQSVKTNLFTLKCDWVAWGPGLGKVKRLANRFHCEKWGNYGLKLHIFKTLRKQSPLLCISLCGVRAMRLQKLYYL